MKYQTIGIIGSGVIGRSLFNRLQNMDSVRVDYVLTSPSEPPERDPVMAGVLITDPDVALERKVDLVVEAAAPQVLARLGPRILENSDLCGFSCAAFADSEVEEKIRRAALENGTRFYLPHGAILGLDGLMDGRGQIDRVVVTTTKSGPSLGLERDASGIVFDGTTREACARFPRNVNVHAAVALAGLGFDRTRSVVVADPETTEMKHHIAVTGAGLAWDITVKSTSLGGVTGSYTPDSAIGSLQRILGHAHFINV